MVPLGLQHSSQASRVVYGEGDGTTANRTADGDPTAVKELTLDGASPVDEINILSGSAMVLWLGMLAIPVSDGRAVADEVACLGESREQNGKHHGSLHCCVFVDLG